MRCSRKPSGAPVVQPMAAIHDATSVHIVSLPMNPGAVLEALWEQNGK